MSSDGRARRWLGRAGAALALLLAGAGIGAALTHLLAPPRGVLAAPSFATVEARSAQEAVRKAPPPYRKYLGEIYAEGVK